MLRKVTAHITKLLLFHMPRYLFPSVFNGKFRVCKWTRAPPFFLTYLARGVDIRMAAFKFAKAMRYWILLAEAISEARTTFVWALMSRLRAPLRPLVFLLMASYSGGQFPGFFLQPPEICGQGFYISRSLSRCKEHS